MFRQYGVAGRPLDDQSGPVHGAPCIGVRDACAGIEQAGEIVTGRVMDGDAPSCAGTSVAAGSAAVSSCCRDIPIAVHAVGDEPDASSGPAAVGAARRRLSAGAQRSLQHQPL